jgi:hypothetical protein
VLAGDAGQVRVDGWEDGRHQATSTTIFQFKRPRTCRRPSPQPPRCQSGRDTGDCCLC